MEIKKEDLKVSDSKIWLEDSAGNMIAFVEFPEFEPGKVEVTHTIVDPSIQGQGVADFLTQAMAEKLLAEGKKAELTCSYAIRWFHLHREFREVLADPEYEEQKAKTLSGHACGIPRHRKN
ncbi:MAG: N-acetyltransferase [Eubacterium sp.]|nr:N-acetyltransferase [Eubacterium sp.]